MKTLCTLFVAAILASCSEINLGPRSVEIATSDSEIQWLRYRNEQGEFSAKKEEWKALSPAARGKLINWLNARHNWQPSLATYSPDLVFKRDDFNLNCGSGDEKIAILNYRRDKDFWVQVYTICEPADWVFLSGLASPQ